MENLFLFHTEELNSMEAGMKYLLRFLFSIGVLFLLDANTVFAQPINTNGGFEDATPGVKGAGDVAGWTLLAEGGAAATYEIIEGDVTEGNYSLRLEIGNLGTNENPWDIQAVNEPFTVVPGTVYTYTVWAKADVAGPIVNFTVGSPTFTEWGRAHQIAMTTDWQQVTFRFTAPASASAARAPIHFGESANAPYLPFAFYVDDLQIMAQSTAVEKKDETIPFRFELGQNYPNPFNPSTVISFQLPVASEVSLMIFSLTGEFVRQVASGKFASGKHNIVWDATDDRGVRVASGTYFYQLTAGDFQSTRRMIFVK
jgi:hypothetical protein